MLRYPCGPPSQRHQISGSRPSLVRSSAVPASLKFHGRSLGLPVVGSHGDQPPMIALAVLVAVCGHHGSLPKSAPPTESNDDEGFAVGPSSSNARPSSPSP